MGTAQAYHARCAPDVGWGPILGTNQHLQGPVLPRLYVLSEVLVLETKGALGRSWGHSWPAPTGLPLISHLWATHPRSSVGLCEPQGSQRSQEELAG